MIKPIVIVGPTGVGKTKLSIMLAKKYKACVISCDSVQLYKDFNIGSAKIKEDEKEGITHYFIDLLDLSKDYSVADYQREARDVLNMLIYNNKPVIIVGGTGLYVKALLYGYRFEEEEELKNRNEFDSYTNEELKEEINKVYPENNINLNNRKRMIRFLSSYKAKGKIIRNELDKDRLLYDSIIIGLTTSRNILYDNINKRVDKMIEEGLVEEAKDLYDRKVNKCKSIIGYKELYKYFDGEITLDRAIELIKQNTRRFAKRQYTWFNNQMDVKWFTVNFINFNKTFKEITKYIKKQK